MRDVLDRVKTFREVDQQTPVLLMGYANPVEHMGYAAFADAASEAGLDGLLTVDIPPEEVDTLNAHLQDCPNCMREWRALVAIDHLFRTTPALAPAAGFTQRTLSRLPDRRYRVWLIGSIYMLLLLSGALPLAAGIWAVTRYGSVITEPGMVQSVVRSLAQLAQAAGAVLGAIFNGVGNFVVQQPAVLGWLLVMIGMISVWSGIYTQLLGNPQWRFSRSFLNE